MSSKRENRIIAPLRGEFANPDGVASRILLGQQRRVPPRRIRPRHNPNGYVAYTGAAAADPFAQDTTVRPNDVTASLWLLIRAKLAKPSFFICPSTADLSESLDGQSAMTRSNFSSGHNLSYSYASPFTNTPGYKLDDFLPADFALLADKNPGVDPSTGANVIGPTWDAKPFALAVANSTNHRRAGQNVLYADGHVSFQPTPFCGFGKDGLRDNIYTALSRTPVPKNQNPPAYGQGVVGRDVGPAWERRQLPRANGAGLTGRKTSARYRISQARGMIVTVSRIKPA